ncbi:hypothetical protein NVP1101O_223 [Vibrio phage 1.101.O._10N.261.45.C6]|nr:hypothetical protein NVP1101O_223 [Vibrio phage 1.101.O._10N.261.45.C6]
MRINLNNPQHTRQVSDLCETFNCSPTQLLINLINNAHAQLQDAGGNDVRQENTTHKDK